ncbi:MAG: tetraacyldisaccharide 4'-kinase [Pseudomonadota bacterium]
MKPPLFWQAPPQAPGLIARLLSPLSIIWRAVDDRRWRRGAHVDPGIPVICVGNINMGGTGKTPTVIWLLEHLRDFGLEAHVVSRGYGGRAVGPLEVRPEMSVADVGDEPLLLAAFARTWVAKDRLAGVRAAKAAGAGVVILDDGMQNPSVAKAMTIMVVDAGQGFGNGRIFPAGPLRQSVEDGVARADAVLVLGEPKEQSRFADSWPQVKAAPVFRGRVAPLQTGMDWSDLRVFAFAGIGRPAKFFATLRALGANVAVDRSFADHQPLSDALLTRMEREAAEIHAQMVTTEKDAARLPARWRGKVLTLPVRLEVEDQTGLLEQVEDAISKG